VTALQAEITAMAPQVAFYEHRRAILNMDNNTIKQKMAAILQGQLFKDAHNEGLKTELQRLRQLYQQQQLQQPVSPFWLAVSSPLDPRIVHNVISCVVHTHKVSSLQGVSP
jgi:hypothetical protein